MSKVKLNIVDKTPEQVQPFVAEISGRVNDVINNRNEKSFKITTKTGNIYSINPLKFFVLVHIGDLFYGKCGFVNNDNTKKDLFLLEDPFVLLPNDPEITKNCFVKANNKSFTYDKATQLHNKLSMDAGSESKIVEFLDDMCTKYNKNRANVILEIFKPICSTLQAIAIAVYWYKNRCLRQLYLFGLNNKDIFNINLTPAEIYKNCMENPLIMTSLTLDKCENILKRQNKIVCIEDKIIALTIREIEDFCTKQGHTGIPTWLIVKKYSNFKDYYPKLSTNYGLIGETEMIYTAYNHKMETYVANEIAQLLLKKSEDFGDIIFTRQDISEDQKLAIAGALNNWISIITGPGGSGKTTIIKEIIANLEAKKIKFKIGSFTGKAVSRIREVIGQNYPITLDRLIMKKEEKDDENSEFEYLIIDEISMVNTELIYRFMKKFYHIYKIIVVGDINQLPPIGVGAFLGQLIKTELVKTFTLTTNHRIYKSDGNTNKIMINTLGMIMTSPEEIFEFEPGPEFQMLHSNNIDVVINILKALKMSNIEADDITILTGYNKFLDPLNKAFQSVYNNMTEFTIDSKGRVLYLNDRVAHNYNDYENNIMNSDFGKIIECKPTYVKVEFTDKTVHTFQTEIVERKVQTDDNNEIKRDNVQDVGALDVSFALTIHKAQGSEWKYVICYLPTDPSNTNFLTLNFLYTAFTRARMALFIIGDMNDVNIGVRNRAKPKYEKLATRIIKNYTDAGGVIEKKVEIYDDFDYE